MDAAILALAMAIPLAAAHAAQDRVSNTTEDRTATAMESPAGADHAAKAAETAPPQPRRRMVDRRRRGSMIGYIEDATVTSQVRVRFDTGFGVNAPDRAEFFYAKCGCYIFDPPPTYDPDAPGPGPGVPTKLNFQQLYIQADYAVRPRLALFAELPVRAIQPQGFEEFGFPWVPFANQSGLADIRLGAKMALIADQDRDLTLQVRTSIPTGDASKGLSTNHWSIEPVLLFHQTFSDRFGLEAQIGDFHPFDGSAGIPTSNSKKFSGDVLFYGIGPSYDVVSTERFRFTPVVELVGWHVFGGFQTSCPGAVCTFDVDKDDNIVNLKLGARVTVADQNSFYAGYGWGLTSAVWYERVLRVEYRYKF